MVSRSRKQAGQHDLEKKKWFLGQGRKRVVMTWSRNMIPGSRREPDCYDSEKKKISRSRKQASQHDPEEKTDF